MSESSGYSFDLDGDLDDVPDLPSFTPVPTGAYLMVLEKGIEQKEINKHPSFSVNFVVKEVMELKEENLDVGEEAPKAGDTTGLLFQMDNETGAGFFKKFAEPLAEHLGTKNFRQLMTASKGLEVLAVFRRVSGKGDKKDVHYNQLVSIAVV